MEAKPVRVLVVDDSAFMRRALTRLIERDPQFTVVGHASTGEEGVDKALSLRPDVVTLDVQMPGMGGLAALRALVALGLAVVMVSAATEADAAVTLEALACGAVDFVPKAFHDRTRNVFRDAGILHDKLRAAALAVVRHGTVVKVPVVRTARRWRVEVAVVGCSTGGPYALQALLEAWGRPAVPVVVAQHMPPVFTQAMAVRLAKVCGVDVAEARDGDSLVPGRVLIAPGGLQMRVVPGGCVAVEEGVGAYRPSVEVLAGSAADVYGAKTVGVMLTGMGHDGVGAFGRLKVLGAPIVAQDSASCVVDGMPKAVRDAGLADAVVGLSEMGAFLKTQVGPA